MKLHLAAACVLFISACTASIGGLPPPPTAGSVETIRYEKIGCYGECPVFVLTVRSDGGATFDGQEFTAVKGVREFRVTSKQFAEFQRRLAPYRPVGERLLEGTNCLLPPVTDASAVDIKWQGKGPTSHLYAYYGCDMERNREMFVAIRDAPYAISQVAVLIGR